MNLLTNTDILAALELWQKEVAASSDAPTVDDTKPTDDTKSEHNMHGVIMMFRCEFAARGCRDARYKTWC